MSVQFDPDKFKTKTNYVIQASAGTGKTYNIVEIVDKLLGEVSIEQILIVTYTDKAAGELKERLRKKLNKGTINNDIDNASIGTIHSFCKNTIEEFCISANKPSDLSLIDEGEVAEFVKQYIRTGKIAKDIQNLKETSLRSNGNDLKVEGRLEKCFAAIITKYYLDKNGNEDTSIIALDPIYSEVLVRGVDIKSAVPGVKNDLDIFKNSSDSLMNDLYNDMKDSQDLNYDVTRYQVRYFKSAPSDEVAAFNRINDLKQRIKEIKKIRNEHGYIYDLLCEYSQDLYREWQRKKEKYKEQTYNDMIRCVREEVVSGGQLLSRLKEKYRYAIIDEFQDTNQLQWDIFSKVFLDDDHNIIVVGDPKQSIYAFQGADIQVYEKAVAEIITHGGADTELGYNYRSTENMVECTPGFFDSVISGFAASKQAPKNSKMKALYCGKPAEAYWISDGSDVPVNEYALQISQLIVDFCTYQEDGHTRLQLVDSDGVSHDVHFGDFAVLARSRTELEPISDVLGKSGIPYLQYKDRTLFKERECAHWAAVLDAINAPDFTGKNRAKFKKALFTVFFEYSLTEIKSEEFDKDNIPEIKLFDKWKEIASKGRWDDLIDRIIIDTEMEKKLGSLKDVKRLGVIRQLGDYCIEYLSKTKSLEMLVENLRVKGSNRSSDDAEDGNVIARSTDFECVKVMTIHASKGLEFPVVISGFGLINPPNKDGIKTFHDEYSDKIIAFDSGNTGAELTEEWKRLMYVAYTRAQYILILPTYKAKSGKKRLIRECTDCFINKYTGQGKYRRFTDNGTSFTDLKNAVSTILEKEKTSADSISEVDQRTEVKKLRDSIFWHSSFKHAYSSLSHSSKAAETISNSSLHVNNGEDDIDIGLSDFDTQAVQIDCAYDNSLCAFTLCEDYPSGSCLGNALHDILETMDYTAACSDPRVKECFKAQGLKTKAEWTEDTKHILDDVMRAVLPVIHGGKSVRDATFTLSSIDMDHRKNEVEFNFNRENDWLRHFFNGFIDLIIKRGEYYSILDWKSDRLNEEFTSYSDAAVLKSHVDKLYSIQRVLYSYTLIKWLGNFYRLSEEEIFEHHFGGVYYVFLRGCNPGTGNGVYAQTWKDYADLKAAYDKIVSEKLGG